jgi:hypothetical protein
MTTVGKSDLLEAVVRVGRYVLTDTASRMLALEVRDWITFGAQWPEIDKALRAALQSPDREPDN